MNSCCNYFLLVFSLVWQLQALAADTYFVIHVKGTVTNQTSGKALKVGDKISSEDKVIFGASDAAAIIMGPKGKFTLTPSASAKNNTSELSAFVKATMLPLKSNGHLSTRGEETTGVSDLKNYFGPAQFAIIGNKHSINLNPLKYTVNDKQIFVYRYVYEGTVITKKIASQGNTIILDKIALYTNKGNYINPEKVKTVEIYSMNTSTNKSQKITSFSPVYISESDLKEQLLVQKKILIEQKRTEEEINNDLLNFIMNIYGKTDEKVFREWAKQNLN